MTTHQIIIILLARLLKRVIGGDLVVIALSVMMAVYYV